MTRKNFKFQISNFKFKDKKVLVVGLARSGVGAANLLSHMGAKVCVTDKNPKGMLEANIKKLSPSIKVVTDGNPEHLFAEADLIVVSPGVPLDIPPLIHAKMKGIPIIGELELAYQIVKSEVRSQKSEVLSPAFIGITGTNGKSTTTTLIDIMLRKSGFRTLLAGNIGNALTEEIYLRFTEIDYIVTEVSSFQLESISEFRPKVAAVLNITVDHLDRYREMDEYIDAKARILENQDKEDYLILNADDPIIKTVESEKLKVKSEKPNIFYFSRDREVKGVYFKNGTIYCNLPDLSHVACHASLINVDEIKIKGIHNLENAMAASAVALISGCSQEAVRQALRDFAGLEHRLEFVSEINGVRFINDSKGTNIGAVIKSLEGLDRVILIMGGMDKGDDFSVLQSLVRRKVKTLILLGQARDKIARALREATETLLINDLDEAVKLSVSKASRGDVVLLSPGCASFDMFTDFEDRGRRFKEAVSQIPR